MNNKPCTLKIHFNFGKITEFKTAIYSYEIKDHFISVYDFELKTKYYFKLQHIDSITVEDNER